VLKLLVALIIGGLLAYCGATVKLGNKTFFGHVRAIWHSEEVQELEQGVKEKAGPAAERVKRGVEAGYHAMKSDAHESAAGSGSAAHDTHAP
jgi:hypothetical protein